jgi:hypothetical protein
MPDDFWPTFWLNLVLALPVVVGVPLLIDSNNTWFGFLWFLAASIGWAALVYFAAARVKRRRQSR